MQSIDIKLQPSKLFIGLFLLIIVGSVGCIVSLSLSIWFKGLLILAALSYGLWILWFVVLMQGVHSIIRIQLLEKGACKLHYAVDTLAAEIQGDSTVTPLVCVLRFAVPGKRRRTSCVIFRDALDREEYRQLLVWLRCC